MKHESISRMPSFGPKSAFWRELRAATDAHLDAEARRGRPRTGDPRLARKTALILAWFALSYGALLLAASLVATVAATLSLAFAAAAIGFGVFHDSNHGTLFRRPAANLWAARLCAVLIGASRQLWVHKHQGLHHRLPNVIEWDDDLETRGFLRLSPETPWKPGFRRQEVKAIFLYGLNSLEWVFLKDFQVVAKGRMNEWQEVKLSSAQRNELLLFKALHVLLFVLPIFLVLPLAWAAVSFILFHLVFSWVLAAVFQVSHLTAGMEFGGVRPGDDWATHQMRTTADYGTDSRFVTWFTGGLNHQIEHHLFPNVAHSHYRALHPIVREVAERHGLECHNLGSLPTAVRKHLAFLKTLGAEPERSVSLEIRKAA